VERRIERLEGAIIPDHERSPDLLAVADRLAAATGTDAEEIIAEAERLMVKTGPPVTLERMAAVVARERGMPVADVLAEAERLCA